MTTSRNKALQRAAKGLPNKLPLSRQERIAHGASLTEPEMGRSGRRHNLHPGPRETRRAVRAEKRSRGTIARNRALATKLSNILGRFSTPDVQSVLDDKASRARATGRRNKLTAQTAALRKAK